MAMAVFSYTATEIDAALVRGTIVADTPRAARDQLRSRGLTIHALTEQFQASESSGSAWRRVGRRRVAPYKLTAFVRELSTLLGVGMPLLEALDTLAHQERSRFRTEILRLRERVAAGVALADAMRQQAQVFDEAVVLMTEVGENAGTLDQVLADVADYRERGALLRGKIGSALLYPAIVMVAGIGVSIFLMTYVVPGLLDSLIQAGRPLPLVTRIVKGVSDGLLYGWPVWLGSLAVVVTGLMALHRTRRGRRWFDRTILLLPGLGALIRKQAVARIAFIVATLMRSGIAFEKAVGVAERSVRNVLLRQALHDCGVAVTAGREIAAALEQSRAFPQTVVQVIALGQQTGRMEEMLDRLATDYDRQIAAAAGRLAAVLEPLLILLLAGMVGTIAFATLLPILQMGQLL
jgi:type II secretory pathway component PulF